MSFQQLKYTALFGAKFIRELLTHGIVCIFKICFCMKVGRFPFCTRLSKFMNFKFSFATQNITEVFNNFPFEDDFRHKS